MIDNIIQSISNLLWNWPMILMILGTHIFLTVRLKFPQRYIFKAIKLSITPDKNSKGDISPFGALTTALAATVGTGNIIGVGTAVALGGPGAVFWCWFAGILGISTKYAEGLLAVKYRIQTPEGNMLGGPMYALERGLGWKFLGILFAIFTAFASLGIGSMVQANAISTLSKEVWGISPYIMGITIAFLSTLVIVGGIKSIAEVCKKFIPCMVIFYVLGCVTILCLNYTHIIPAIKLILQSAFSLHAIEGGVVGSSILIAARYGIARGLFSSESGMGSEPIVAAAVQTKSPVRQGLVSSTGTFWDTVVICALTGIAVVSSILAYPDISFEDGGILVKMAFGKIPYVGEYILAFSLLTFAFSTILGWSFYGEKASEYLAGKGILKNVNRKHVITFYRTLYLSSVFVGAIISLNLVWNMADIFNALMAIPNLLSLLFLSQIIVEETKKHLWSCRLDEK